MGATAHLKAVSLDLMDLLQAHPGLVESFLCGLPTSLPVGLPVEIREQLLKSLDNPDRLQWLMDDIAAMCPGHTELVLAQANTPGLNLDKWWEELAPCIADTDSPQSPLGRCITGGTQLGPNLGYGPARVLNQSEVEETSAALEGVDTDLFKKHAQAMGLPANSAELLLRIFSELRQYYRQAAGDCKCMLMSME